MKESDTECKSRPIFADDGSVICKYSFNATGEVFMESKTGSTSFTNFQRQLMDPGYLGKRRGKRR